MNGITRARLRSTLATALRPVPSGVLVRVAEAAPGRLGRAAGVGLLGRRVTIAAGVGAGLSFNCGASNPDYVLGRNEQPVQELFATHVRPGDTVMDVGANVGFFTMVSARLSGPTGRVIAIEPAPANAALIRENARANGFAHVEVIEAAAGARGGTAELWIAAYAGGHALSTADRPPDAQALVAVPLLAIDELVRDGKVPVPDLVKIDVEGAELDVVEGMEATLQQHRPTLIVEIDDADAGALEAKWARLVELLDRHGYAVERVEGAYDHEGWHISHALAVGRDRQAGTGLRG